MMKNFKIIQTGGNFPDVLLYRDRNDEGKEIVVIMAIGILDGTDDYMISEDVSFETPHMAKCFVGDFSKESADKWCADNKMSF